MAAPSVQTFKGDCSGRTAALEPASAVLSRSSSDADP